MKSFVQLGLMSLALLSSGPVAANLQAIDQIDVIVNEGVVLRSQVEDRLRDLQFQLRQRGQTPPPDEALRIQAREQLILEAIQLQLAERNGIRPDDTAVNNTLTAMARQNNQTLDAFRERVDNTPGTSFASLRAAVGREQIIDRLRQRRMGERIRITDADIDQFMSTPGGQELNRQLDIQLGNASASRVATPATPAPAAAPVVEYFIEHLVIPVESNTSAQDQARLQALAERLLVAQRSGIAAADVINQGGQQAALEPLGWRSLAQVPESLRDAVAARIDGAEPTTVRTARGWHLLWVTDRRSVTRPDELLPPPPPVPSTVVNQRKVRHILMRPNELQNDEDIELTLRRYRQQIVDGASMADLARLHSQDPGSAIRGGDLDWVSPGDMVPEFDRMIGQVGIGEVSPPFRSSFGWHILRVEDERRQDMRNSILRDRARQILFARAYDEELGSWLREIRAEAFVDYRGGAPR